MKQITENIFYEDSFFGVTVGAIIYPQGTLLVDAPLQHLDARSWESEILQKKGGKNRILVSLDPHHDRTLGAYALQCTILAHQITADVFKNRAAIFKGQSSESGSEWETYSEAIGIRWAPPDITFNKSMSLHWGGPEITLEHHPASSPGAIWVIVPDEKIMFIGDTVTPDQPPFLTNADLDVWVESLDLLVKSYKEFSIICGRGGMIGEKEVRAFRRYLKMIGRRLDRRGQRDALPEETEKMVPNLLSKLDFPAELEEQYFDRLRSGLYQYYLNHYMQGDDNNESSSSESD